jgi:cadmium resistance protein CadD (predicted permease)
MTNLMIILGLLFAGVVLMVVLGERFAKPADDQKVAQLSRWLMPLVGLSIVLALIKQYW